MIDRRSVMISAGALVFAGTTDSVSACSIVTFEPGTAWKALAWRVGKGNLNDVAALFHKDSVLIISNYVSSKEPANGIHFGAEAISMALGEYYQNLVSGRASSSLSIDPLEYASDKDENTRFRLNVHRVVNSGGSCDGEKFTSSIDFVCFTGPSQTDASSIDRLIVMPAMGKL